MASRSSLRFALAALAFAATPAIAQVIQTNIAPDARAPAALAEFVIGAVTARARDGVERSLSRGSPIYAGDRIDTADGRMQLRFTDGGYVSLLPNTDFSVRDYSYDGRLDGSEASFFNLSRGAMRAVTGWIGRINKSRYTITTPTATIGVRGTGGLIEVALDGTTHLVGTSGIWTVANGAGQIFVPAGTAAIVTPNKSEPPRTTTEVPIIAPTPAVQSAQAAQQRSKPGETVQANASTPESANTNPIAVTLVETTTVAGAANTAAASTGTNGNSGGNGNANNSPVIVVAGSTTLPPVAGPTPPATPTPPTPPVVVIGTPPGPVTPPTLSPLASGTYGAAVSFGYSTNPAQGVTGANSDLYPVTSSAVTIGTNNFANSIGPFALTAQGQGNGLHNESGNNGVFAWGRWNGQVQDASAGTRRTIGPSEGLHYVLGPPPGTLPTANPGGVAVVPFSLIAATAPTFAQGNVAPGSLNGALGVDFGAARVGVQLNATFGTWGVAMTTAGGVTNPAASGVTINPGATFGGNFSSVTTTGTGAPASVCAGGCSGGVAGMFGGATADQAGLVFRAVPVTGVNTLSGAAIFQNTPGTR